MNRKDLQLKNPNPIAPQVFLNIIIMVVALAGLGVAWAGLAMKNRNKVKELAAVKAEMQRMEDEIDLLEMDLSQMEDSGKLSNQISKIQEQTGLDLRGINPEEPVKLPAPDTTTFAKRPQGPL